MIQRIFIIMAKQRYKTYHKNTYKQHDVIHTANRHHIVNQKFMITRGIYKGTSLFLNSDNTTRPTKALVKKSFFDVMQGQMSDKIFIECFAGSGQMGFESLSNGAKKVIFFEKDMSAFANLTNNIRLFDTMLQSRIQHIKDINNQDLYIPIESYCMDFFSSLPLLESLANPESSKPRNKKTDFGVKNGIMSKPFSLNHYRNNHAKIILYLDPPFSCRDGFHDIYTKIVNFIQSFSESLLQKVDVIVIEKMSIAEIDNKLGPFCLNKISKFGKTSLVYFKKHT